MDHRIAILRAKLAAENPDSQLQKTRDRAQQYLIQHTAHMRQLSNIVKTVGPGLTCLTWLGSLRDLPLWKSAVGLCSATWARAALLCLVLPLIPLLVILSALNQAVRCARGCKDGRCLTEKVHAMFVQILHWEWVSLASWAVHACHRAGSEQTWDELWQVHDPVWWARLANVSIGWYSTPVAGSMYYRHFASHPFLDTACIDGEFLLAEGRERGLQISSVL
eukprot:Skav210353  [mRNA]  locus=scaffold1491:57018:62453:+ [translate_table: standard]